VTVIRRATSPLAASSADAASEPTGAPAEAPAGVPAPLPACPATPNCVSSEGDPRDAVHFIAPLSLPDGLAPEAAMDAFEAVVRSAPRSEVLERAPLRLRAIDRTAVFRFVDDVDARIDPAARLLHVRSASRVGRGDLGANRRRVSAWLRELSQSWGVAWPPR
jgi:uncharacterized protein (DUF1499 family)